MEIFQIAAVGIIGAILSIVIKKQSPEFSLLIGICTGVIIFIFISGYLLNVIGVLYEMAERAGIKSTYIGIVVKVIGISYVSEFGVQLCSDAGENSIASKIELAGKVLIMIVSAPVLLALTEIIMNII